MLLEGDLVAVGIGGGGCLSGIYQQCGQKYWLKELRDQTEYLFLFIYFIYFY